MKLHYADYGRDKGTVLIILHGLLGSERNWHTLARRFEQHVHVLALDLRNHGHSPHDARHSVQAMREDLHEFVESHALQQFFLLGHSMGGHVAMDFAFHHPGRLEGLIVEDIAPRPHGSGLSALLEAMMSVDLSMIHEKRHVDEALSDRIPDPVVRHFVMTNLVRHDDRLMWRANLPALHEYVLTESSGFQASEKSRYDGPALFIGGTLSSVHLGGDRPLILRYFPNSRLEMVDNAHHWVHYDAKDQFFSLVMEFIHAHRR